MKKCREGNCLGGKNARRGIAWGGKMPKEGIVWGGYKMGGELSGVDIRREGNCLGWV